MLDGRRVVAEGRHEELVRTSPLYAQLAQQLSVPTRAGHASGPLPGLAQAS